jgi:hypothetical protein
MKSFGPNGQKIGNVVRERLSPMWVRDGSDQEEAATYNNEPQLVPTPFPRVQTEAEKRRLGAQWERVMNALVDHHEYSRKRCDGANHENE